MMKQVLVHRPGGPDSLDYVDAPILSPGPGQIRAEAYGVGHPDVLIRTGVYKWMPPLPANPGNELAGRITAVGVGVTEVSIGTKVLLTARDLSRRGGCYAEYVVVPADAVHVLPEEVDVEAAVCLTNYQAAHALLQECLHPRAPKALLVVGAAGGVGTALVQLGKRAGMTVIGTVSTDEKAAFARANGADHVVFYRREDVVARAKELAGERGIGLVLDHVSGPEFTAYLGVLGKWGTLVTYNAFAGLPEENLIRAMRGHMGVCPSVRCFSFHIYDDDRDGRRALMAEMIAALARGEIRPVVAARFALSDVRSAHALLDSGGGLGKIIMNP